MISWLSIVPKLPVTLVATLKSWTTWSCSYDQPIATREIKKRYPH